MIDLEKAKDLKEAGLVWEPKSHDLFAGDVEYLDENYINIVLDFHTREDGTKWIKSEGGWTGKSAWIWLPSLSQLLTEVEKNGYCWVLRRIGREYRIMIYEFDENLEPNGFFSVEDSNPEDAVAKASLYILNQNKK